jgi:hypothetical protein
MSYVLVAHNNFPPFSPNPVSSCSTPDSKHLSSMRLSLPTQSQHHFHLYYSFSFKRQQKTYLHKNQQPHHHLTNSLSPATTDAVSATAATTALQAAGCYTPHYHCRCHCYSGGSNSGRTKFMGEQRGQQQKLQQHYLFVVMNFLSFCWISVHKMALPSELACIR